MQLNDLLAKVPHRTKIREGDWLHTGDVLVHLDHRRKGAVGRPPNTIRLVYIERIIYENDLTRSFVLAPVEHWNPQIVKTRASEKTLRETYRMVHTNEVRIQ